MRKLSFYLVLILCLVITGCGSNKVKTLATLTDFEEKANQSGFSVKDNTNRYGSANYIIEAKVASLGDIDIEMIKYTDSESAIKVQDGHIESFNLLKSTGAQSIKEKGSNYYKYALISNGRYMISTRVDNTLIFAKVMLEEKENVDKIIDALGY